MISALLPRAAQLQVRRAHPPLCADFGFLCAPCCAPRAALLAHRFPIPRARPGRAAHRAQVTSGGDVRVVSGVGDKGTSCMQLSGGKGLGPDGGQRLAGLLREAPPPLLTSLVLRRPPSTSSLRLALSLSLSLSLSGRARAIPDWVRIVGHCPGPDEQLCPGDSVQVQEMPTPMHMLLRIRALLC